MFMKQALSIGINNYSASRLVLEPCLHDAKDVSNSLRSIGFQSHYVGDVDLNSMKLVINEFTNSIQPGAVVVFYFSGHGVESNSINYLIPRNILGISAANIGSTAIDAQQVINAMHKRNPRLVICILDCCRTPAPENAIDENRFFRKVLAGTRPGLAPMRSPQPTIIVYACAAYESALANSNNSRNSLYTHYLLRYIRTPNVDIETVLKQVSADCQRETNNEQIPYRYSSCNEFICLASYPGYKGLVSPRYIPTRPIAHSSSKQHAKALAVHHSQSRRNNFQHQLHGHFGPPVNYHLATRNSLPHMKRIPWEYGHLFPKELRHHRR